LAQARTEIRNVKVEPALFRYTVEIIRRSRGWPSLALGASPRAAISLLMVAKAMAGLEGRDFLIPDDVKSAALPVLRHRVMIKPEAELEGLDADRVLSEIINSVEVPR
jgi:MoxR-like ATPase